MNKSISMLTRLVWFGVCAIWLIFPAISQAGEIDPYKPMFIAPGKGIAIFSFTTWGTIQDGSNVRWRARGGIGSNGERASGDISINAGFLLGNNEEFSKTSRHGIGRLVGLELPAGDYEFYSFHSASYQKILTGRKEFSRRFSVEPDKIQYIGNLDILATPPVFAGGAIWAGALFGTWFGSVDVYPSLLDTADIDLPLLAAKGIAIDNIARNVIANEEDKHALEVVSSLKTSADKGDLTAQSRLMSGLLAGWFIAESGEEFKLMPDKELQKKLAENLSIKGVAGGAFFLGEIQNPLVDKTLASASVDGAQVLNNYLADAGRYFPDAMSRAVWIYDKGLPGVARDSELSSLWDKRLDAMATLVTDSVPYLDAAGKKEFEKFRAASMPRYFALSASGAYGMSEGDDSSIQAAIAACEARNVGAAEHCRLYAKHRWLTWDACPAEYAGPQATTFPPVTGLGRVTDISHLPANLNDTAKASYRNFLAARMPRAFAVSDTGEVGMASGDCHAAYKALQACSAHSGKACQLYALDDQIVLGATDPKLVEQQQRLAGLVEKVSQGSAKLASQSVPVAASLRN